MSKLCKKCGIEKLLEMFYVHKSHRDGLTSNCKECIRKRNRKNWLTNKKKIEERRHARRIQYPSSVDEATRYQRAYIVRMDVGITS